MRLSSNKDFNTYQRFIKGMLMRKYAVLGSRGIGGGGSRGGRAVAKIVILRRLQRDNEIRVVLVER